MSNREDRLATLWFIHSDHYEIYTVAQKNVYSIFWGGGNRTSHDRSNVKCDRDREGLERECANVKITAIRVEGLELFNS